MIAVEFVTFVGKGIHVQDALQGFLDNRGRVGETILRFTGNLARLAAENHGRHDDDGKAGEHDARQLQRGDGDQGDAADQDGGLAKKLGQDGDQGVFNLNQVAGKPAGQLAHAALREKRHGQRDQSGVGVAAQIDQAALPGGDILTVDAYVGQSSCCKLVYQIYSPTTGAWTTPSNNTVVNLVDPSSLELGPMPLLPNGTVFAAGATTNNAIYTVSTGTWASAPKFGGTLDIADGPAAVLPNGNALFDTSPGVFNTGSKFFEWDGTTLNATSAPPNAGIDSSYVGGMVVLPTGQVLFTDFPIVRITDSTGAIVYCATHSWLGGVATGTKLVSAQFDVPATIHTGADRESG